MIVVKLAGGLGNQLFQYSFAKALSHKFNQKLYMDTSSFSYYQTRNEQYKLTNQQIRDYQLKYFNIKSKVLNKYFQHHIIRPITNSNKSNLYSKTIEIIFNFKIISPISFSQLQLKHVKNIIIEGYWQNQDIIEEYKEELLKELSLKEPLHSRYGEYLNQINSTNSIGVHIRRGDYVDNTIMKNKFVECNSEYYHDSISYIDNIISDTNFFVFSDDIEWARNNINYSKKMNFVDIDGLAFEHLYLMSRCKHQIIANSTFSWWAAWLNKNSSKLVLYPKNWYYDKELNNTVIRIPSNWIEIENKI